MRVVGLDVGSRSVKLVVMDECGRIVDVRLADTTFDPSKQCLALIEGLKVDRIQATGYGRHLMGKILQASVVPEILAHARAVHHMFPNAKGVLDIGGQDTKCIALGDGGRVIKFEMNDRCAAGTGKFLEIMAGAFGMGIEKFGAFALEADEASNISSMCTVFAESEATSLMARGERPSRIALGLHVAVARRALSMVRRVSPAMPIAFTGGVALNPCMRKLLAEELEDQILIPSHPQLMGAIGAALLLLDKIASGERGADMCSGRGAEERGSRA
jgi:predicted CoA-substrate-specific enzyme activase